MELDELRARWQQSLPPPDAPTPSSEAALRALLARRSGSPVAKMRRGARLEVAGIVVCLIGSVAALALVPDSHVQVMSGWLIILCLLEIIYLRRKLLLLKHLNDADDPVHGYVTQQLASLRSLLQLYYRATMWSLPMPFGIGFYFTATQLVHKLTGQKLLVSAGKLVAAYLLFGGLTWVITRGFTTWYLQWRYGQHLDRLEQSLAELDEPATNFSD